VNVHAQRWARVVDVLCVLGVGLALVVALFGGFRFRVGDSRVAITSPLRVLLWAVGASLIRHLAAPRPPIHRALPAFVASWFTGPHAVPALRRLVESARAPLPPGEARLFDESAGTWPGAVEWLGAFVGFSVLVAVFTWPQVRHMESVPDIGDPLFSIWRLSWISHQIVRNPRALFDANIFYPERLTLTYSDPLLVSALISAPFYGLGLNRALIYNVVFLSGFVFSGMAMYLLVRALTGRRDAAALAGVVFALYPYRYEHYSHLELQMAMWMPIALWALHRTMARGRLVDGLVTGAAFALQMLSSLYYGEYFTAYIVVVGGLLWIGRRFPMRPLAMLAAGTALAGVLIAPVALQYIANEKTIGERNITAFSAEGRDFLKPHFRNRVYGSWSHEGYQERQLFPHITPVAVALVGAAPPLTVASLAYTIALAVSFDASLGVNGMVFPWLREYMPGYRSLRAPARFSMLCGMTLAVLCGLGAARLLARWPRANTAVFLALLAPILIESWPNIRLEPVWSEPPAIYERLKDQPPSVLAEFPTPATTGMVGSDTRYLYFSTFHWQKLLNGYSGFMPPSYFEFLERTGDFPSPASLSYLRERGVQYITWHGAFTTPGRYERTSALLDARPDLELVATAPWGRSESRLYRFK
jgi:hypothetical protein